MHRRSSLSGILNLFMCTGSAFLKRVIITSIYWRGASNAMLLIISFKMAGKQFPSVLGDSDHGNDVSPGNSRILGSESAMLICIHTVWCSRMHYRFIMPRRLLLKNSLSRRSGQNLFLLRKYVLYDHMFWIYISKIPEESYKTAF